MISENTNDVELNNAIKNLQFHYNNLASTYCDDAQNSRPEFAHFYNELWQFYDKAATSCEKYFLHLNILHFCQEQLDLGFVNEVGKLKKLIQDPNIQEQLSAILSNYDDDDGFFEDEEVVF